MITVKPGVGATAAAKAKAAKAASDRNAQAAGAVKPSNQTGSEDNKWSAAKASWGSNNANKQSSLTTPNRTPAPKVSGWKAGSGPQPAKFVPATAKPVSSLLGGPPKVGKGAAFRPTMRPVAKVVGAGKASGAQVVPPRVESSSSQSLGSVAASWRPPHQKAPAVKPMAKVLGGVQAPGATPWRAPVAKFKAAAAIPTPLITSALTKALQPAGLAHVIVSLTKLGVENISDLKYVTDEDLAGMQLSVIQRRKFREVAEAHGVQGAGSSGKDAGAKSGGKGKDKNRSYGAGKDADPGGTGRSWRGQGNNPADSAAADEPAWKKGKSSHASYWKAPKKDWDQDWKGNGKSGGGGSSWGGDDGSGGDSGSWKGNNKRKKSW